MFISKLSSTFLIIFALSIFSSSAKKDKEETIALFIFEDYLKHNNWKDFEEQAIPYIEKIRKERKSELHGKFLCLLLQYRVKNGEQEEAKRIAFEILRDNVCTIIHSESKIENIIHYSLSIKIRSKLKKNSHQTFKKKSYFEKYVNFVLDKTITFTNSTYDNKLKFKGYNIYDKEDPSNFDKFFLKQIRSDFKFAKQIIKENLKYEFISVLVQMVVCTFITEENYEAEKDIILSIFDFPAMIKFDIQFADIFHYYILHTPKLEQPNLNCCSIDQRFFDKKQY